MRATIRPAILILGLAAVATGAAVPGIAIAQASPSGAAAAVDAGQVKQIQLTPALVDRFLAAKKAIDTVLDQLPDGTDQPDPATLAKLDTVARQYEFDDYKQYDMTENNIGIVMAGMDPMTKQYIGPEAVIKKQIAEIGADKQISAQDRKDTIDQLNAAMATIPKLQYPGNVDAVAKNFDKLNESMPQD